MSVIGVDLGTTGCRAIAMADDTTVLAESAVGLKLQRPRDGHVEVDPLRLREAAMRVISDVASHDALRHDPPAGLSFSSQGEAVLGLDRSGPMASPLTPMPVSIDQRGHEGLQILIDAVGEDRLEQISGQPVHPMFSVPKMMALAGSAEGQIASWRLAADFITEHLCGIAVADTTSAARSMGVDVSAGRWSAEIIEAAGLERTQLPALAPPGTAVAAVRPDVAVQLGLPQTCQVVTGAHDQACAYFGAGLGPPVNSDSSPVDPASTEVAQGVASLGSSECVTVATRQRPRTAGTGLATYQAGDLWLTLAGIPTGGFVLDWFRDLVSVGGPLDHVTLYHDLPPRPTDLLVLPYLAGGATIDNDPTARGVIAGLTLQTSAAEIARALLEASGYEIRRVVDKLASAEVCHLDTLRAVGTGAGDNAALQVRSSAAEIGLQRVDGQASCRGAALLALNGVGNTPLGELCGRIQPGPRLRPLAANRDHYRRRRDIHRCVAKTMPSV